MNNVTASQVYACTTQVILIRCLNQTYKLSLHVARIVAIGNAARYNRLTIYLNQYSCGPKLKHVIRYTIIILTIVIIIIAVLCMAAIKIWAQNNLQKDHMHAGSAIYATITTTHMHDQVGRREGVER